MTDKIKSYLCSSPMYPAKGQAFDPSIDRWITFQIKSFDRPEFTKLLESAGYRSIQFWR
jgi:hypothetical protein